MEQFNQVTGSVNIDEAINITSGTRKYQKLMMLILMLNPMALSPIIICSGFFLSEKSYNQNINAIEDLHISSHNEVIFFRDIFFAGIILGSLITPFLADRYGRKKIIKMHCMLEIIFFISLGLSRDVLMLRITGFFIGLLFFGIFTTSTVLGVESLDYKYRALYVALFSASWWVFSTFIYVLSYYGLYWRYSILLCASLLLLELFLLKYIHESPRFLVSNAGDIEACTKVLNKISLMNGEGQFLYLLKSENPQKRLVNIFKDVCASKMIMIKTISCSLVWFIMSWGYYSWVFIEPYSGVNFFLMTITKNTLIILGLLLSVYLVNKYGRKMACLVSILSVGILYLSISLINMAENNKNLAFLSFILSMTLNYFAAVGYIIISLYSAEQFPTYIRCTCFGIAHAVGRSGALFAVSLPLLPSKAQLIISITIGVLMILTSPAVILLEETKIKELDEMVENDNTQPLLTEN